MKRWTPVVLVSVSTALSIAALHALSHSFLWLSLIWLSCFWIITLLAKGSRFRVVWFNLGFVVLALGTAELYSYISIQREEAIRTDIDVSGGYYTSSDILGYTAHKGITATARKFHGDELVFEVVYTIDDNGLRISPPSGEGKDSQCILFFGGSYTFGEGVNDDEAMPYVVGILTDSKVYNFGFHGYGPHQMLSAIEHGMVEEVVACEPTFAIYQAIQGHVARSAGLLSFSRTGPKYVLEDDGSVRYAGHFEDDLFNRLLYKQLAKSFLYEKYFENHPRIREEHVDLLLGIVTASREKLMAIYPGIQFHVILWVRKSDNKTGQLIIEGLEKRNINIHLIGNILPDYSSKWKEYQIEHGVDGHPNALAHRAIAEYLANQVIGDGH